MLRKRDQAPTYVVAVVLDSVQLILHRLTSILDLILALGPFRFVQPGRSSRLSGQAQRAHLEVMLNGIALQSVQGDSDV